MNDISVIIPVYNMRSTIERCLDSIFSQKKVKFQIIIIDDGSTDDTIDVVQNYPKENIKIICSEHRGPANARNQGLKAADGKYVLFCDADDYYPSDNVFYKMFVACENNNAKVCAGNIQIEYVSHTREYLPYIIKNEESRDFKNFQDVYYHTRYMVNRNFLINNEIYYPELSRFEDPPFLVKMLNTAEKIYMLPIDAYIVVTTFSSAKYSENKIADTLDGIESVLQMALSNDLEILYKDMWSKLNNIYSFYVYYYLSVAKSSIIKDKIAKFDVFKDSIYKIREAEFFTSGEIWCNCDAIYNENIRVLNELISDDRVIIYGAGKVGKQLEKILKKHKPEIEIEFVVTEIGNNDDVLCVEDYLKEKDNVKIVIAVRNSLKNEMNKNLKRLGFLNVYEVDERVLNLFELDSK